MAGCTVVDGLSASHGGYRSKGGEVHDRFGDVCGAAGCIPRLQALLRSPSLQRCWRLALLLCLKGFCVKWSSGSFLNRFYELSVAATLIKGIELVVPNFHLSTTA